MSRWQIVWWWHPRDWAVAHIGPYPESGAIYSARWQFGPFEIRKWEAGRAERTR